MSRLETAFQSICRWVSTGEIFGELGRKSALWAQRMREDYTLEQWCVIVRVIVRDHSKRAG